MPRRIWGSGSLYKRGRMFWGKVRQGGRVHQFSLKTTERREALRRLALKVQALNAGEFSPVRAQLVLEDLERLVADDHQLRHRKRGTLKRFTTAFKQLTAGLPAQVSQLTNARVRQYAADRLRTASPSSVAVEIGALRRGLRLAVQQGLLERAPDLTQVGGQRVRQGFVDWPQMETVLRELPEDLRPLMLTAYLTGWRVQSELMQLRWEQVDWSAGLLRLEPGMSKTGRGREFPFTAISELRRVLEQQRDRQRGPFVFHRDGKPIKDYDKAWRSAVKRAGLPELLVHDLRRSAVRNLEWAGVPRSVAMQLTGHASGAVYSRYAITSRQDLERGGKMLGEYHLNGVMQGLK